MQKGFIIILFLRRLIKYKQCNYTDINFHRAIKQYAFRKYEGSTFTEKDRNKLNNRNGPLRSDSVIKLVSDLITESDQAVHSCNCWFSIFLFLIRGTAHDKVVKSQIV